MDLNLTPTEQQFRDQFRAWLTAVSVLPDDDVWAVGNAGLIVHKTPDGWRADVSTLNQQWGSDHYPIVGSFRAPPPPVE